jgi:hypothetical protein
MSLTYSRDHIATCHERIYNTYLLLINSLVQWLFNGGGLQTAARPSQGDCWPAIRIILRGAMNIPEIVSGALDYRSWFMTDNPVTQHKYRLGWFRESDAVRCRHE